MCQGKAADLHDKDGEDQRQPINGGGGAFRSLLTLR